MEFRKGILFIRLKGDLNKDTIKGIIDKDFKYVVLNIDDMYSIDSYSIKYLGYMKIIIINLLFVISLMCLENYLEISLK